ncbi:MULTISPECIES: hypothetical protein [Roseobacteraceae]|uniref:Uncharacterized protein n=1 Tax=Falsiruegeria litorea TaxID=1280831 RepID=A0ABS5WWI4_9RHOB|nr:MULTISPECIES: hypothetical protein [Roseobacteraceae]MBT3143499.1 hypothetical protein [Falsiruegeria litorea]MBT8167769.1 hypothetical protein [Falsiruegeria litorea]
MSLTSVFLYSVNSQYEQSIVHRVISKQGLCCASLGVVSRQKPTPFCQKNEKSNFGNGGFVRKTAIKSSTPNSPADPDHLSLDHLFPLQNTTTDPMVSLSD